MRKKVHKTYVGTDGIIYAGKAIKQRRRLELRQKAYEDIDTPFPGSFSEPGSMNRKK